MIAMTYGNIYVARVAFGMNDTHTVRAFREAEAYDGCSLILAYSHCIAHGYDLKHGLEQQEAAVKSGHWPLMRYNPTLAAEGKNPLILDSKAPSIGLDKYMNNETRFTMLMRSDPAAAKALAEQAQVEVAARWKLYEHWAAMPGAAATQEKGQ
jgi:pyruvate-ferredoxin/flavodoxin oxidoreductase